MKRLLVLLLLYAGAAFGQTTVNLTVSDTPDAQTWNNGTWTVVLQASPGSSGVGPFTIKSGGGSVASQSGSLSATGTASISLPANANINPSQSIWSFSVCPQATWPCYQSFVTVSTTSPQTLTILPPSIRINFQNATPPVTAYTNAEVVGASLGSQYYNLTSGNTLTCTVSIPCTWANSSGNNGFSYSKNAVYASPNCSGSQNCYFVNANTHWVSDAVVTNTSQIVTATDGNFLNNAKVGQIVWAVHGNLNLGNGVLDIVETTILSVDSATQIHTTASAGASGNPDTLVWGTLDTPTHGNCGVGVDNLKTAWNAALNQNVPLWLPAGGGNVSTSGSGGILVECSELQSPITSGNATYTGAPSLIGEGGDSYIMATPLFDFTSVPGGYGALASIAPSAASVPNVGIMRDVAFMCGGYNTWGTGQNIPIIFTNRVILNNVTGWGCGAGGSTLFGFYNTGTSTIMAGMFYNFGASYACTVSNGGQNASTVFTGTGYCSGPAGLNITTGSWVASYGTFYQAFGSTAAVNLSGNGVTFNSFGDILDAESNNSSIALKLTGTGDKAFLSGTQLYTTTMVPTFGLAYVAAVSSLALANTSFFGTTGAAISGGGLTGLVYDQGNNTYTAALTICAASACTPIGSGSANQTLLTGAKLVLSANWGTGAAVSVPLGADSPITFTITNGSAAVGASPTITYTFPTPYWVAPLWCTATDASGTNPLGTFTAGVPTTTSVVFTFSLTPTINDTELMQVACYPAQ